MKVAASPSPILHEQTALLTLVEPTAVFNIVDFLLKEENPMGESTVPLTTVDIAATAAVTAAATAASKARPRGRPTKGKKLATGELSTLDGGPTSLDRTGQRESDTVAASAPAVEIVQVVEGVEEGVKEFSAEGEEMMVEGLLSVAPSPTPADSVSLSDCMRSFTTLEKLSEKIVSYLLTLTRFLSEISYTLFFTLFL